MCGEFDGVRQVVVPTLETTSMRKTTLAAAVLVLAFGADAMAFDVPADGKTCLGIADAFHNDLTSAGIAGDDDTIDMIVEVQLAIKRHSEALEFKEAADAANTLAGVLDKADP